MRWIENFRAWNKRLSLRIKGLLSLLVVIAYALVMTVVVTQEQMRLPGIVHELDRLHKIDERFIAVTLQGARISLTLLEASGSDNNSPVIRRLFAELASLDGALKDLAKSEKGIERYREVLRANAQAFAHGVGSDGVSRLRSDVHQLIIDIDRMRIAVANDRQRTLNSFQQVHDKVTLVTMFFLFLGVIVVGAVMTIFFTRLTWDIRRVGGRAMAIVKGFRGKPMLVSRGDEVGDLMHAVNQMQIEIRSRERQLELGRQQQFHHEKMAAVGSLAAAVAHEINNPIMAITGLANVLLEQEPKKNESDREILQMISEQAKRISVITRQISEFALPHSPEPALFDLNTLIRNTANFVRFDQRYRRIELELNLDPNLSAVIAVADQITQVLINLLLNAADAFEQEESVRPKVNVETREVKGGVEIEVRDNGSGMPPDVLERVFDEFFTTKPRGKGTGLGLFLCKTLIESNRGEIQIQSELGAGTRVLISFSSEAKAEKPCVS